MAVKRLGVLAAAVLALALVGGKGAPAQELQANCVLPSQTPVWLDFADGSVPFWQEFAKPGIVALASNLDVVRNDYGEQGNCGHDTDSD